MNKPLITVGAFVMLWGVLFYYLNGPSIIPMVAIINAIMRGVSAICIGVGGFILICGVLPIKNRKLRA